MCSHGPNLHIHPYTPPYFPPTLFPICISFHPELVAGAPQCMGDMKHGHVPAPPLTPSPGWGACFVQDSPLPRSTGCLILACGQYGPARLTAPGSSHGPQPLQAPSDPDPRWKAWFTHSWMLSWIYPSSLLLVIPAGSEADASVTAALRKLSGLCTSTMVFLISNHPDKTHSSHSAL